MIVPKPPSWPTAVLSWFCSSDFIEEVEGDLLEYYERDLHYYSTWRANFNYVINVIKFMNHSSLSGRKSYESQRYSLLILSGLRTTLRNALNQKLFSFLNLSGLVLGITSCLFLFAYVTNELSYDTYHPNVESIFRLTDGVKFDDDFSEGAIVPSGWSNELSERIPEIQHVGRISQAARFNPTIKYDNRIFTESNFIFIDSTLLNIFHYNFIYKKAGNPLSYPNAILITDQMAQKYFGDQNPLGEVLHINNDTNYEVAGVLEMPKNNSFSFDFAAILQPPKEDRLWTHTFLRLKKGVDPNFLETKVASFLKETYGERPYASRQSMAPNLQPLTAIHHYSDLKFEYSPNSSATYIYLFSAIGAIILLITVFNFINLYTAKASSRTKEINIRKVVGALKGHITFQFLMEGLLYVVTALAISLFLVLILNPLFNDWSNKEINFFKMLEIHHWVIIMSGTLVLGFLAAVYPSIFLSTSSIRRNIENNSKTSLVRRVLVVGQFALSTLMIIGTLVISRQLELFQNTELGYDKMSNIILRVSDKKVKDDHESFRNELLQNSAINHVSFTQTFPGEREKMAVLVYKAANSDETTILPTFLTDLNFAQTLGLELTEGRYFDSSRPDDRNNCLINRKAAELMGWKGGAIGKEMHAIDLNLKGKVIGVMENFNFSSLHSEIEPVVIFPVLQFPQAFNSVIINAKADQIVTVIPEIKKIWRSFSVDSPFNYSILNDNLTMLYEEDLSKGRIFKVFVILSVIISCIGLLGLTIYTLEKKTKEISIRKVLGASARNITLLFSGNFLKLVVISNLIAIPLSYWLSQKWLEDFSYHIVLSVDLFLIGTIISCGLASITIVFLTIKKSLINPARQLKYE